MPDWLKSLTASEKRRLETIERQLASLNKERRKLMNRANVRKHRAEKAIDD